GARGPRARRVGAVLRLGRRLQPAQARARRRAGRAQGAQPARHRRAGGRGGQPGLPGPDRRVRRPARLPPDGDPARVADREASEEMTTTAAAGVELTHPPEGRQAEVLSGEALAFVAELERRFGPRRRELLQARAERRARWAAGELLDFLPETREVR